MMVAMNPTLPSDNDSSLELSPSESGGIPAREPSSRRVRSPRNSSVPVIIAIVLVAVALLGVGGFLLLTKKSAQKAAPSQVTINTQSLDTGTLTKLTTSAGSNTKQRLIIQPDAVFNKTVQIKDTATTDKDLSVGGSITVTNGTNLQGSVLVGGNLAVRGALSVGGSLSADSLNVGSLNISNLTASGSLSFGSHLVPSGAAPTATANVAASGGSVNIGGNDTAGTITITTGNGPVSAGELASVAFHTAFSTTPKVQLTPINGPAASLNYYATRSPKFFTIETASVPTANTNYVFDYLITQ